MEKVKNNNKDLKENEKIATGQENKINHGDFLEKKIEKDNISPEGKAKESDIKNPRVVNNSFSRKFGERKEKPERKFSYYRPKTERLDTKRVSAGSKGGRRFSFTSLVLILMEEGENHGIAFANAGGKESIVSFRKAIRKAQKKLINYFPDSPRTIPHDILVKYKATKIFLKPASPGSGIKAGGVLNKLFKFLKIKDISAKIIGSRRSKLNVIRAAFLALDKLTGKKYDY
jgi:small subunit ribosomal protein S5